MAPGQPAMTTAAPPPELIAYNVNPALHMPLVRASAQRAWMESTDQRFANRCLPLLIANQSGWFVLSSHTLRVVWGGRGDLGSVKIDYLSGSPPYPAVSHFGHGIVTWHLPYVFRTPEGYNLLVRGPPNWPKDGASALEGTVETDWSPASFTMNWKITRPNHLVHFEVGEPICMLLPQRRGELEAFHPKIRRMQDDPPMKARYQTWAASRAAFLAELPREGSRANEQAWQKDYFQGRSSDGQATAEHQTKLHLRDFEGGRNEP